MSFTSPPALTLPDTSADIIRPRKLGTVNCINVARIGEPVTLRYFGASALCGATGQAHPTQAQAEADVLSWADGKPVAYEQHAVVPLGTVASPVPLADGELALLEQTLTDERKNSFAYEPEYYEIVGLAAANALPGLLARVRAAEATPALKTYQAWQASAVSATQYLQPGDEVDEQLYDHFAGVVSPQYHTGKLLQVGEAYSEDRGRLLYMTFGCFAERYLYMGILPPFKQPKH